MTKPRILVVDDDGPILLLMKNLLREFGFEAGVASSGTEALAMVGQQAPDLVLLDLHMPGMSGAEVVRALRAKNGLAQMPILMLSGAPMSQKELAELGANGAVQKPFDIPELIEQIRASLSVAK
jgi:CheY-like chemotaxis protein